MKLTKCSNGHFYDSEKYSSCPHCSNVGAVNTQGEDKKTDCWIDGMNANNSAEKMTRGFNEWQKQQPSGMNNNKPHETSVSNENSTVAYLNWQAMDDDVQNKNKGATQVKPIVGWLVCVEGEHYGKCFSLYGGKNFIGRSAEMDICLSGDNTVSRVKHAIIIYEPKGRKFFAQPGESHELFYLNDSVVLSSTQMKDRDVITVGKTSLVFVPFCDERYGWLD